MGFVELNSFKRSGVSGKKLLAMDGGSGKVVGIGHASVAGCRSGTVRDWPKPRCFVIPGRSDAKRSADPGIHAVTSELRTRCRTPFEAGGMAFILRRCILRRKSRHGFQGLRDVASLLLRPGMTKSSGRRHHSPASGSEHVATQEADANRISRSGCCPANPCLKHQTNWNPVPSLAR